MKKDFQEEMANFEKNEWVGEDWLQLIETVKLRKGGKEKEVSKKIRRS